MRVAPVIFQAAESKSQNILIRRETVRITLHGTPDFRFEAKNPDNGHTLSMGASKALGGDESGFRPMQVMLASLGGCAGIDVINILKKQRIDFDSVDVGLEGDREAGKEPSPFTRVKLTFTVTGRGVAQAKVEKAVQLSVEKYCSALASLHPSIVVETESVVVEAGINDG
jgi:putative redox protein